MAEYIEREALKEWIHSIKTGLFYTAGRTFIDFDVVHKAVVELPAADVVEVRHGEWGIAQVETGNPFTYEQDQIDVFVCSECATHFDISEARNYCPNCGAKMDGKGEDNGNL